MNKIREAVLMAIDAFESFNRNSSEAYLYGFHIEIAALRAALDADSKEEPFGYFRPEPFGWAICAEDDEGAVALYETPPQRKPLTDEDIEKLMKDTWGSARIAPQSVPAFAHAIERAHGIGGEE